jgi:hypothetical protein
MSAESAKKMPTFDVFFVVSYQNVFSFTSSLVEVS